MIKKMFLTQLGVLYCAVTFSQSICATAQPINAGLHVEDTIVGTDLPNPICAPNGTNADRGEWYIYTPSQDYTITINTDLPSNSGKDTRVHVYTGMCGNLTCLAGDDDSGVIGSGLLAVVSFPALQGNTYYIAFDNNWSSEGFDFELIEDTYVAPNGLSFATESITGIGGFSTNMCVVDMNGDYLDDIVNVPFGGNQLNIYYQQNGGTFQNNSYPIASSTYSPDWSMAAGDLDKNGYNDLIFGGGNGVQLVLADATGSAYSATPFSQFVFSQRTNCVDINNDGHLDAFICHDVEPNVYLINDGNNGFSFNQGGMGDNPQGGNYGSLWSDFDNDGDVDMFIAKCRGGGGTEKLNELHRNEGNGVFTNVSVSSNLSDPLQTWSSAVNDFDNDGDMDIVVGASASSDGMHKVMRNNNDGTFTEVTANSGFDIFTNLSIEFVSFDFNNDGNCDVLGAGRVLLGNGDLTFTDAGINLESGPVGDLNNDGFLDIQNNGTLYMNEGNSNNWIKVGLTGSASNANGIGARVEVYSGGSKQIRDVRSGEGFAFMNTLNVHVGLGQSAAVDSLKVLWPSGSVSTLFNPAINEQHQINEDQDVNALSEIEAVNFTVVPNPVTDIMEVSNYEDNKNATYQIIDASGKVVASGKLKEKLNVSSLRTGAYQIMLVMNGTKTAPISFLKQ